MVFVLFNSFGIVSNFLICIGDDKVGMVYGDEIGCKLVWEMIFFFKFFLVDVWVRVFCFF